MTWKGFFERIFGFILGIPIVSTIMQLDKKIESKEALDNKIESNEVLLYQKKSGFVMTKAHSDPTYPTKWCVMQEIAYSTVLVAYGIIGPNNSFLPVHVTRRAFDTREEMNDYIEKSRKERFAIGYV